jgi:tight adherence protein C
MSFSRQGQQDESIPLCLVCRSDSARQIRFEDIELQQPFIQRVVVPLIEKFGEISTRFTPQKLLQETTLKLELAGNPGRIDAATFLATRFVGAAVFGGGLLLIALLAKTWPPGRIVLVVGIFTAVGFFFPNYGCRAINSRQGEVRKALPDALDL